MYRRTCTSCCGAARAAAVACAADSVAAGQACASTVCAGYCRQMTSEPLAEIIFPIQQYTSGLCPDAALVNGTMFTELIK